VQYIIAPLWRKGYTGFFLDTLDAYLRVAADESSRQKYRAGLVEVIHEIRRRFPDAALILNRGFELLPAVHEHVYAVAFESLYQGWSEARGEYVDVPEADRKWLLSQVRHIRQQYNLPVIAIDYCHPANDGCARQTVQRIRTEGLVPYVGDGRLQQVSFAALR